VARITVHLRDSVSETWIEVDGEQLQTDAVQFTGGSDMVSQISIVTSDVEVIDERSGVEEQ
jgi:hypothetical protein